MDAYAPKNVSPQVDQRYQSVRIIAAYDTAQLARTPATRAAIDVAKARS